MSSRRQRIEVERQAPLPRDEDRSIAIHEMSSSTSVFRTPSSVLVERSNIGPALRETGQ